MFVYVSDSEGKQHTTKTVGSQLETTNSLDGYALASKENEKNTEFYSKRLSAMFKLISSKLCTK